MGNRNLRKLLVVGAHAVLFHRKPHTDPLRMWAKKLENSFACRRRLRSETISHTASIFTPCRRSMRIRGSIVCAARARSATDEAAIDSLRHELGIARQKA